MRRFSLLAVVALITFAASVSAQSTVFVASVRWSEFFDPFYVDVVLSTIDSTGKTTDIATLLSGVWSEYIYYPSERTSALSLDGLSYYYSIWNPSLSTAQLITFNTVSKNITYANIPFAVPHSNGQPIRSMNEVSPGVVGIVYGNVIAFISATTGAVTSQVTVFPQSNNYNSTKMSAFDPNSGTYWLQVRNDPKSAKPCQYTYGYNMQTKKTSQSPCVSADRGLASLINGVWANPSNASLLLVVSDDILGASVGYYDPIKGQFGATLISFQKFVDNKIQMNGQLNTYTYNPKRQVFQFLYSSTKGAGTDGIGTASIPSGSINQLSPLGVSLTQEGWQPVLNEKFLKF